MSRPEDPLEQFQRQVERLWRDLVYYPHPGAHFGDQTWAPPADVVVSDDSVRVILELAGVPRESVKVLLRGNLLEISGRRTRPSQPRVAHWHRAEIYFGEFRRVLELPWPADERTVKALYRDGMLEIRIQAAASPQRTDVPIRRSAP